MTGDIDFQGSSVGLEGRHRVRSRYGSVTGSMSTPDSACIRLEQTVVATERDVMSVRG